MTISDPKRNLPDSTSNQNHGSHGPVPSTPSFSFASLVVTPTLSPSATNEHLRCLVLANPPLRGPRSRPGRRTVVAVRSRVPRLAALGGRRVCRSVPRVPSASSSSAAARIDGARGRTHARASTHARVDAFAFPPWWGEAFEEGGELEDGTISGGCMVRFRGCVGAMFEVYTLLRHCTP